MMFPMGAKKTTKTEPPVRCQCGCREGRHPGYGWPLRLPGKPPDFRRHNLVFRPDVRKLPPPEPFAA